MRARTFNLVNGHATLRGHVSKSARDSDQTLMRVNDAIDEVLTTARNIEFNSKATSSGQAGTAIKVSELPDERLDGTGAVSGTIVLSEPSSGVELFPDWKSLDLQTEFPRCSTDEGSCRIRYERIEGGECLRFQSSGYGDLEIRTHGNGTLTVLDDFLKLPPLEGMKPILYSWS